MTARANVLVCGAIALIAFVCLGVTFAKAHDWYDGECCSGQDCRQTVLKEVERRDDGWFVVPTQELIPYGDPRIRRSLDPLIHLCPMPVWKSGRKTEKVRCLYVPEMGG